MIKLHTKNGSIEIELQGNDNKIIAELSDAVIRMLEALEKSNGNPVQDNLTLLILMLLNKLENDE